MPGKTIAVAAICCLIGSVAFGQMNGPNHGVVRAAPEPAFEPNLASQVLAGKSDAVILGKVVEQAQAQKMKIQLPGQDQASEQWGCVYKVEVSKVFNACKLIPAPKAAKNRSAPPQRITVYMLAPMAAGDARGVLPGFRRQSLLVKDATYILYLKKLPKADAFMPISSTAIQPELVNSWTEFEKDVNPEKWPWGKTVGGLQMAVFTGMQAIVQPGGPADCWALIAVRNAGKKPIALNLYPKDKFLKVALVSKGKTNAPDLYEDVANWQLGSAGKDHVATLAPGEIVFLNRKGTSDAAEQVAFTAEPGDYQLKVTYESNRKGTAGKARLWVGKLESKPADIKLEKMPIMPSSHNPIRIMPIRGPAGPLPRLQPAGGAPVIIREKIVEEKK